MSEFEVNAVARDDLGKAATRRLRREGLVPAVLYGGTADPASVALRSNELKKQLENEAFYSHLLTVVHSGKKEQVVLKGLQRHPATDVVIHVDFQRASATQVLHMLVPLHFVNEESSVGRKAGGAVTHMVNEVAVTCMAKDLPEYIEVDVADLDIGDTLHLSDLKVPQGVELDALTHDDDQGVVNVHAVHSTEDASTEDGDEAAAAEGDATEE
jgi:large subunit ribosomal protein L25